MSRALARRRLVVFEHLTLDGVMQAPGRPDEDRRDGFEHGGWATLWDPVIASVAEESMASQPALLFGRRTYEDFYGFWPQQTDNPVHRGAELEPEIRAPDPPAGAGIGTPAVLRRRRACRPAPRRCEDLPERRRDRDVPIKS